jgi:hypothetical protein
MAKIIGIIVVFASVLGGFILSGGQFMALVHPTARVLMSRRKRVTGIVDGSSLFNLAPTSRRYEGLPAMWPCTFACSAPGGTRSASQILHYVWKHLALARYISEEGSPSHLRARV